MVARYREITLSGIGYFAVMLGCSCGQVNQWAAGGSWRVNSETAAGQMGLVATCPAILPGEWNYLRVVRYSHAISGKR